MQLSTVLGTQLLPVFGQPELFSGQFGFQVNQSIVGQPAVFFQQLAGRLQQSLVKRRIEQNDVKIVAGRCGQVVQCICANDLCVVAVEQLEVLFNAALCRAAAFQA